MIHNVVFALFGITLGIAIDNPFVSSLIFPLTALLAIALNQKEPNIVHLCAGLFLLAVIERLVFLIVPVTGSPQVWVNNRIYVLHLLFDIAFFTFLIYRGTISRALYTKLHRSTEGLHLTNADISLFGVAILFIFVDLAATIENLLRNLDYLGFSEEVAKPLWELNWIFYNYSQMKMLLLGLQFLVLWSTLSKMAKEKSRYADIFPG